MNKPKTEPGILYIDSREPSEVIRRVTNAFHNIAPVETQQLECGDFIYNNIVIERKDCTDFISSWKDARLINQRNNLMRMQQRWGFHPYIVLQGDFFDVERQFQRSPNIRGYSYKTWINGIASLAEMGINVIQLMPRFNHERLAQTIIALDKHFSDEKVYHDVFIEPEGFSWDHKSLQCIKGVGYNTAKAISDEYSIRDLMRRTQKSAISALTGIEGIGNERAKKIYKEIQGNKALKPIREL